MNTNMNLRYPHFDHEHFTAGDYEQFVSHLQTHYKNRKDYSEYDDKNEYDDDKNEYDYISKLQWEKYNQEGIHDYFKTFEHIFYKYKKGIYVQIIDNKINIFLPFSNVNYVNEYENYLFINREKYKTFPEMYEKLCFYENRPFNPKKVNKYKDQWYCNNGLIRYEFPIHENESGINMLYSMIKTLCEERKIPDCEFFINKRDFPILRLDDCEPYKAMVGENIPLYSYNESSYLPILSMCTHSKYADIPIPTWEDWSRASYQYDERTFSKMHTKYPDHFYTDWSLKKNKIVFRGASTGLGTTCQTNPRLFFSKLSHNNNNNNNNNNILDIGITKWNLRPRKNKSDEPIDIIDPSQLDISLVQPLTPYEQSEYKYILHLPGHSCAYRLSLELSMMSVIFLYPSEYKLWYISLLKPYIHYIPLEKEFDENEIYEKFEWCQQHPELMNTIIKNARNFYDTYLSYDSILNYMQKLCFSISKKYRIVKYCNLFENMKKIKLDYIDGHKYYDFEKNENENEMIGIKESKNTMIYKYKDLILKKKKNENDLSHEHFFGLYFLKRIQKFCPNFGEIFTYSDSYLVMPNYESKYTLEMYIQSNDFQMEDFKMILLQIVLALQLGFQLCGFLHFDLCPWNILLIPNKGKKIHYHFLEKDITLSSKYLVKIIDYDKSHVYYNGYSIHNMSPFYISESNDIICLLYNSIYSILKYHKLMNKDISFIINLISFLSKKRFQTIYELKTFLYTHKKYANLISYNEKNKNQFTFFDLYLFLKKEQKNILEIQKYNDWYSFFDDDNKQQIFNISQIYDDNIYQIDDMTFDIIYSFKKYLDIYDDHIQKTFENISIENMTKINRFKKKCIDYCKRNPRCFDDKNKEFKNDVIIRWSSFSINPSLHQLQNFENVILYWKHIYAYYSFIK
jgi:hypothetical protein